MDDFDQDDYDDFDNDDNQEARQRNVDRLCDQRRERAREQKRWEDRQYMLQVDNGDDEEDDEDDDVGDINDAGDCI